MAAAEVAINILAKDQASAVMGRVGDNAERTGKKFGKLHKVAIAGGALAGAALVKFGKDSVAAFTEAEQSSAQLDLALKKFPKTADVTRASFDKLNTSIMRKTGVDDDALASGQAVLAQFNLTGKQIQDITPLLADYATKTGKELPAAATDLGRAFMGNTRALKALGINYKATGDKAKDQAAIQQLLKDKIGGTAEAMGNTASGKVKILQGEFSNLQETAGSKLVPALIKVADVGLRVIDFISRNQAVIVPLVAVVGTIIAAIRIWTMAQAALNVVMALNPIGLVAIAIGALVVGMVIAYKKSETFRNIVQGAFHAVGAAIGFVKDHWKAFATTLAFLIGGPIVGAIVLLVTHFGAVKRIATTVVGWVVTKFTALVGFVTGLPGKIAGAAKGMFDGIKNAFKSALNWVIDKWNGLEFTLPSVDTHIPGVGKIGGFTLGVPDIPKLATGGIVPATPGGRTVIVGEGKHDEAVIPLPRGRSSIGGNTTIEINITESANARATAREVIAEIRKLQRSGVRIDFAKAT